MKQENTDVKKNEKNQDEGRTLQQTKRSGKKDDQNRIKNRIRDKKSKNLAEQAEEEEEELITLSTTMMAMPLNVVDVAACDVTLKPRQRGVTLTFTVSAVCCQLDVVDPAASVLPSEGKQYILITSFGFQTSRCKVV